MDRIPFDKIFANLLTSREVNQAGFGNLGQTTKKITNFATEVTDD